MRPSCLSAWATEVSSGDNEVESCARHLGDTRVVNRSDQLDRRYRFIGCSLEEML